MKILILILAIPATAIAIFGLVAIIAVIADKMGLLGDFDKGYDDE